MKKIFQWKWNKDSFLILILAGILLFIIILPTENDEGTRMQDKSLVPEPIESDIIVADNSEVSYEEAMEYKLEEAIQYIEGVGLTKVIITLESTEEVIIEKDIDIDQSGISEQDAQGGVRQEDNYMNVEDTIYSTNPEGVQEPYVIKTILPDVEGVVVICQGGGTNTVAKNLTEVIQALFGIDAHKIKIVKMKS